MHHLNLSQINQPTLLIVVLVTSMWVMPGCRYAGRERSNAVANEADIRELLTSYERALNDSDAGAAAGLYHTDGIFMPMGFPSSRGTSEIEAAYAAIFGMIQLDIAFDIEEIEVDRETAIAVTRSEGTVTVRAEHLSMPEANRELFVLRKEGGSWTIYRYMFNKTSAQSNEKG